MSLLDRVRWCRRCEPARFRPFLIDGRRLGWMRHRFADRLRAFPETFVVDAGTVRLAPALDGFETRSRAVADVLRVLAEEGTIRGWRGEDYPVAESFHAAPLMRMERAAVPAFGVRAYGVHLNGYVGAGDNLRLWVARRSRTKPTGPGKLDHLVAGGQPIGIGLFDNLIKECAEEAAVPAELAARARPAGFVSYLMESEEGLRDDVLFVYDLEVPADFAPRNSDGEIEEFFLWPIERVRRVLAETEDFKFNVALVIIDFLVRRGFIDPEDPDYLDIVEGLRL